MEQVSTGAEPVIKMNGCQPKKDAPKTVTVLVRGSNRLVLGEAQFCTRAFAEGLEVIPFTLAENAGLDGVEIVIELRRKHQEGLIRSGIDVKKGNIADDLGTQNVVQPLLVTMSAIALASETVRMILKIDDMVGSI